MITYDKISHSLKFYFFIHEIRMFDINFKLKNLKIISFDQSERKRKYIKKQNDELKMFQLFNIFMKRKFDIFFSLINSFI
jgi:hypothetical protein